MLVFVIGALVGICFLCLLCLMFDLSFILVVFLRVFCFGLLVCVLLVVRLFRVVFVLFVVLDLL